MWAVPITLGPLPYETLPEKAHVEIFMKNSAVQAGVAATMEVEAPPAGEGADERGLPAELAEKGAILDALLQRLGDSQDEAFDKAFVREARQAITAVAARQAVDIGAVEFPPDGRGAHGGDSGAV